MSKRMTALAAKVDKNKLYSLEEAVKLAKETSNVKFDASVELHARLGIDTKKTDQQIRATVILPHGSGKTIKIAAFVGTNDEKMAKESGAEFIYGEEDIKKIKETGKVEFDVAIATPEMMAKMAAVAKVLGPKGLMPNPKTGTVGTDVKKMITDLKKGKLTFKNDDGANVHIACGKVSFSETDLMENIAAVMDTLKKSRPASAKGAFIKSMSLTSSMGPSVKLSIG